MAAGIQRMQPLPLHRIWQFVQAVTARPLSAAERRETATVLSPAQQALFERMSTGDQRHSLNVMHTLLADGFSDRHLLVAGLLHDVGKTRHRLHLWERVLVVVIRAFGPHWASRWGDGHSSGWRRPFAIYQQHPQWGAEMAAGAGCSPLTAELIGRHHESGAQADFELLHALQHADSIN